MILEYSLFSFIWIFSFISVRGIHGAPSDGDWTYKDQVNWSKQYPECAGKAMRQSPIDIVISKVIPNHGLTLNFIDYEQELIQDAQNTGHSVSVVDSELDKSSITITKTGKRIEKPIPKVKLSWMPYLFELQEIHFHWGDSRNFGSEHKVNGRRAAAEMHMVHFRKGVDKDKIGVVEDSVVVVGVFIEIGKHTNTGLELLLKQAARVNGTETSVVAHNGWIENVKNLLPTNDHKFYTYQGSLTTPPCFEVVTWIVMAAPIYVTKERLLELTNLAVKNQGGLHRISKNFRYTQPLQNRAVFVSNNVNEIISSALLKKTKLNNPEFGVQQTNNTKLQPNQMTHFSKTNTIGTPLSAPIGGRLEQNQLSQKKADTKTELEFC